MSLPKNGINNPNTSSNPRIANIAEQLGLSNTVVDSMLVKRFMAEQRPLNDVLFLIDPEDSPTLTFLDEIAGLPSDEVSASSWLGSICQHAHIVADTFVKIHAEERLRAKQTPVNQLLEVDSYFGPVKGFIHVNALNMLEDIDSPFLKQLRNVLRAGHHIRDRRVNGDPVGQEQLSEVIEYVRSYTVNDVNKEEISKVCGSLIEQENLDELLIDATGALGEVGLQYSLVIATNMVSRLDTTIKYSNLRQISNSGSLITKSIERLRRIADHEYPPQIAGGILRQIIQDVAASASALTKHLKRGGEFRLTVVHGIPSGAREAVRQAANSDELSESLKALGALVQLGEHYGQYLDLTHEGRIMMSLGEMFTPPSDLGAQAKKDKTLRRAGAKATEIAGLVEYNQPILDMLAEIALAEEAMLHLFNMPGKELRKEALVGGKESVAYFILQAGINPEQAEAAVNVYVGLRELVNRYGGEAYFALNSLLDNDTELHEEFTEKRKALRGGNRGPELPSPRLLESVTWLVNNWETFKEAVEQSAHVADRQTLNRIGVLLGVEDTEVFIDDTEQSGEIDLRGDSQLGRPGHVGGETRPNIKRARNLARELGVKVFPREENEPLSVDDLKEALKQTFSKRERTMPQVEDSRLEDLLLFMDIYGGELYVSEGETFGDPDSAYFFLRFEHEGVIYMIAENPVVGNSTYVIREDMIELQKSETIVDAPKRLSRKFFRAAGGIDIRHPKNARIPQADKIQYAMDTLATR